MAKCINVYEYRVLGKNGGEYFRARDFSEIKTKLKAVSAARPNVKFVVQSRYVRFDGYTFDRDWKGRIQWTPWHCVGDCV